MKTKNAKSKIQNVFSVPAILLLAFVILHLPGLSHAAEAGPKVRLISRAISVGKADIQIIPASVSASPDSKRMAYVARQGDNWVAVVDGIQGKAYDGIGAGSLVFSPDSRRVAYAGLAGNDWVAVVDGAESRRYDGLRGIVFSPDSKRVAYAANRGHNWLVVVDGVEGQKYDGTGDVAFSATGGRVGYAANRGRNWLVVVDGTEGKPYDGIGKGSLSFSPDGRRLAYDAQRGNNWLVVVDGVEGKTYDALGKSSFISAYGSRAAYAVLRTNPQLAALAEGGEIANLGENGPVFSPDSKHVAYWAKQGYEWRVVVDGVEGKGYDGFLRGGNLVFDTPRSLHALAVLGREALRVDIEVVEEP